MLLALSGSLTVQAAQFNIPEQELSSALTQFSQQSGLNVIRGASLNGLRSTAVNGDYTETSAMRLLLSGTGLEFEKAPDGIRLISPKAQEGEAYVLPATDIIGAQSAVFDKYKTPEIKYEVTREKLDRVPYSKVADIFNGVPGVSSADGSNGAALQINIRGLSGMSRVKTLVDGSMQTANTHRGYSGDKDQTYIDPDLIGGIDIKKGPDAGPQGAGVIGGIVNMRSLNASDIITDADKNWGIRIKGMLGNNVAKGNMVSDIYDYSGGGSSVGQVLHMDRKSGRGQLIRCVPAARGGCTDPRDAAGNPIPPRAVNIGGSLPERNISGSLAAAFRPWDNFELTLAYAERESGNYHSGKNVRRSAINQGTDLRNGGIVTKSLKDYPGQEVINSSQRSDSYLVKSKLNFWDNHSLEVGHIKYRTQYGYHRNGVSGRDWQSRLHNVETATYTLNYAWQPDNPWFDLRANLWKSRLDSDSLSLNLLRLGDITYNNAPFKNSQSIVDSFGGELWNSSVLEFIPGEFSLKYGLSFSQEKAYGYDRSPNTTLYNVNGNRQVFGSFIQSHWQITPWLGVNAGLQRTEGKLQDKSPVPPPRFTPNPPPGRTTYFSSLPDNHQRALDPSYGITLEPHHSVQLFAQWSHGSRMPTIRESLMISQPAYAPNPDLKMERAKNFEYGVNLLFNGLLSVNDSLGIKFSRFDNQYKDYIITLDRRLMGEGNPPYPDPYRNVQSKFANIEKVRFQGYELAADYDNGWLFGSFALTYFDKVQFCYPILERQGRVLVAIPSTCYDENRAIVASTGNTNTMPPRQEKNATLGLRLFDQKLVLAGAMKMASKSMGYRARSNNSSSSIFDSGVFWDNYEVYDIYGQLKLTENLELGFSVENITDRFYVPSYTSDYLEAQPPPAVPRVVLLLLGFN